jgi:hypothetical protein
LWVSLALMHLWKIAQWAQVKMLQAPSLQQQDAPPPPAEPQPQPPAAASQMKPRAMEVVQPVPGVQTQTGGAQTLSCAADGCSLKLPRACSA